LKHDSNLLKIINRFMIAFVVIALILLVMMLVDVHLVYTLYLSETVVVVLLIFLYFIKPYAVAPSSASQHMDG